MLELALLREQRLRKAAVAGIWICAVAGGFGVVGYALRVHVGRAANVSPIEWLALLGISVVALLLYVRKANDDIRKLSYLQGSLFPERGT